MAGHEQTNEGQLPGEGNPWARHGHLFRERTVQPGTVLLKEGRVSRQAFLIKEGCLRAAYDHDGRDITLQFFFEGEGVSSFESFHFGTPSLYRIEAVERSVLLVIAKEDLDRIVASDPGIREQADRHLVKRLAWYTRHLLSFLRDTPKERYAKLLKERPMVVQRVPQYLIASYLGITPVSLSRIRGRVVKRRS